MTKYGWDASNHDWPRGKMDLARAKREGIELFTHKATEGSTFVDPYFDDAMNRARSVGFAVLGAYHVQWPNNAVAQADFWFNTVNRIVPWWRDHPCWVWQIDAELFQEFNPYRAPTVVEINACGDRIRGRSGCKPEQVPVYAPKWLYGDQLRGLRYPNLWSSAYVNGSGSPQHLYPGDKAAVWGAYSGKTPTIGQFTSSATIAGQAPADANAIRVSSPAALQGLFLGKDADDMPLTAAELTAITGTGRITTQRVGDAVHEEAAATRAYMASQIGALTSLVKQITSGGATIDYARIKSDAQAAAEAALDKVNVKITTP